MNLETTGLTGKASVDKPWLKYYPEELRDLKVPKMTVEAFLKMKNPDENKYAFEYYGTLRAVSFTWKTRYSPVSSTPSV